MLICWLFKLLGAGQLGGWLPGVSLKCLCWSLTGAPVTRPRQLSLSLKEYAATVPDPAPPWRQHCVCSCVKLTVCEHLNGPSGCQVNYTIMLLQSATAHDNMHSTLSVSRAVLIRQLQTLLRRQRCNMHARFATYSITQPAWRHANAPVHHVCTVTDSHSINVTLCMHAVCNLRSKSVCRHWRYDTVTLQWGTHPTSSGALPHNAHCGSSSCDRR